MIKLKDDPIKYCEYCGEQLIRSHNGVKWEERDNFLRRKYCNKICWRKNTLSKNDNQSFRNSHQTARTTKKLYDINRVCEHCGKNGKLDVHHKDENWNNNNIENLQYLCRSCHNKQHRSKKMCSICGKHAKGYGYCEMHYQRFKKYGDPLKTKERAMCAICGNLANARGLCGKCYMKQKRAGILNNYITTTNRGNQKN